MDSWISRVMRPLSLFTSIVFTGLAIVFLITGIVLLHSLKNDFPKFYAQFSKLLTTATVVLTIPLMTRAIFDGIKFCSDGFVTWIDANQVNNSIYNLVFFMTSTYLPIIS